MRRMGRIAAAVGAGAVLLGTVGGAAYAVRPDDSVTWAAPADHHQVSPGSTYSPNDGVTWGYVGNATVDHPVSLS